MPGGDLLGYIGKHPDADRLELVGGPLLCLSHAHSRRQLSDVAIGLCYLHSCNVIHGDLKGVRNRSKSRFATVLTPGQQNILMDDSGHAHIADFGLAMLTHNPDSIQNATLQGGYTPQWAAPEVLNEGTYGKEADIFSFAMVMIEVRHGQSTVELWPTVILYRYRYSLARFRSVVVQFSLSCRPHCKASAHHGRYIQPSQKACGY